MKTSSNYSTLLQLYKWIKRISLIKGELRSMNKFEETATQMHKIQIN